MSTKFISILTISLYHELINIHHLLDVLTSPMLGCVIIIPHPNQSLPPSICNSQIRHLQFNYDYFLFFFFLFFLNCQSIYYPGLSLNYILEFIVSYVYSNCYHCYSVQFTKSHSMTLCSCWSFFPQTKMLFPTLLN